jgi:hypothetical protein
MKIYTVLIYTTYATHTCDTGIYPVCLADEIHSDAITRVRVTETATAFAIDRAKLYPPIWQKSDFVV